MKIRGCQLLVLVNAVCGYSESLHYGYQAIPRMVRVDGVPFQLKIVCCVESKEMPPLPVSNIKLRVSGKRVKTGLHNNNTTGHSE
jgi:hypothetical protein